MAARLVTRTLVLSGAALALMATPAYARGGHGGGGHAGGGHFGGGGHYSGGHSGGHSSGGHATTPHYSGGHSSHYAPPAGVYRGGVTPHGPSVGYRSGYIGGGRGAYAVGGRVPMFHGGPRYYYGPRGRLWWGPRYGWAVPVYWGGYYYPYVGYWGLSFWVTDWIMLDYLAAEEARLSAYYGPRYVEVPVRAAPVDTNVREELRLQIAEILASPAQAVPSTTGQNGALVVNDPRIARALASQHHVYVLSQPVTVTNRSNGGTCALTPGDLLRSSSPVPSGQAYAELAVASSKPTSCAAGSNVAVTVADLVRFEEGLITRVASGAAAAKAADDDAESAPPNGAPATPNNAAPSGPQPVPQSAPAPSAPPAPAPSQLAPSPGGLSI